ncbi:Cysteine protease atg4 [Coniosporium apollinis]|uniref:Cysteine protease n=1 Tax=Coniosporium apollinis TaxID=61459 RepID=A0ABQ9NWA4_9PEZI|nr:Cysteine protease atg4 [Coniosporium apollinis]
MSNLDNLGRYSKRVVQYFWDPMPRNDEPNSPVWCLGECYESRQTEGERYTSPSAPNGAPLSTSHGSSTTDSSRSRSSSGAEDTAAGDADAGWPRAFLDDFESRIWFTYRSNFASIQKSESPKAVASMSFSVRLKQLGNQGGFTSDSGWGCMIRSGQSLLANALVMLQLGREWRRGQKREEERRILSLFADDPKAPFSIHRFVEHGAQACGKHPGEWFGPSATARCIQALSNGYQDAGLKVYITGDGSDVYEDAFMKIARSTDGSFHPTLVCVGIRLGIDRVTPVYWEALKAALQMPQSIGIAGGQPSSSHYFIGTQADHFFYLDPHTPRPFLPLHANLDDYTTEDIDSCHTRRLRRIHVREMDPSMLIAFLIRDEEDWKDWRQGIQEVQGKAIINVADHEPALHGSIEREGAVNEVEALDDDEDGLQ